jgi:hypothetical protein
VNTKALIEAVNAQLDMNPNLAAYKSVVLETMNRHYLEISARHPWLFLQQEADWNVYATVEGSSSVTCSITQGEHAVTFSGVTPSSYWEGQTFTGPDGNEYVIGAVIIATVYLTAPYEGATVSGSASWSVEFRRYALPTNCSEPLGFIDRDNTQSRLTFIDRRLEEVYVLDREDTGDAFIIVEDEHIADRAPDVGFAAAGDATASTLTVGTKYEYCYTFLYEGRESPPSVPVSFTTTAALPSVALSGIEDTRNGALSTGKIKRIYRRDATNNGRWHYLVQRTESQTTYTDSGAATISRTVTLFEQSPRQYVRAYYTAGTNATLRLRYLIKPRRLVSDSDTPIWREEYHHLLMYATLQDLCAMHGMPSQATMWERRAKELLDLMKGKCLSRSDRLYVRQGFGQGRVGRGRWPSTVTKTDA